MRKITAFVIFLLLALSPSVFASHLYEEALSDKIKEYGVWNGRSGIIYADRIDFENTSLLIVNAEGSDITCEVYSDSDGLALTDTISFFCEGYATCRLLTVRSGDTNYIMFSRGNENEFYTIENDAFISYAAEGYYPLKTIALYENGKIKPVSDVGGVYTFLNRLKEESIREYTLANRINSISDEELSEIRTLISACADIMSFDIKNYDYDRLFKYVLYTHDNFRVLTDIDPKSGKNSSLGYNNVSIVGSDFIDYIMSSVFRITPEKPPVNNLTTRGFCYNDGYYLYTGGFDVYFATEIYDLISVFDLGGNSMLVIFSDIYYEGDTKAPEYSYAILQKTGEGYSLLRLGMGESLPSQAEARSYSPFSEHGGGAWNTHGDTKNGDTKSRLLLPVLLVIFSVGVVALTCSIIVLIRQRRK